MAKCNQLRALPFKGLTAKRSSSGSQQWVQALSLLYCYLAKGAAQ